MTSAAGWRQKTESRGRLMTQTAPVEGTVQQLAVHTVGGVVTPAQALMVVVPAEHTLEVEAFLENKDIGFVNGGQTAAVKIETFPFTKYGTIAGEVLNVPTDAINDEKQGLVYAARVRLGQAAMRVDARTINLSPGMAVTVEIKTGTRRVIEYFLSPLLLHADESLREGGSVRCSDVIPSNILAEKRMFLTLLEKACRVIAMPMTLVIVINAPRILRGGGKRLTAWRWFE